MLFSKVWIVRICMAFSVLVMFILATHVFWWWGVIFRLTLSMHWELICLYVLLYAIGGLLLGLRAEALLNFRNVRFKPLNFIVLGIIPITWLVYWVGSGAGYWSLRALPFFLEPFININFSITFTSIWLGAAIGKAFYLSE